MGQLIKEAGLSYSDVLIQPARSHIRSRRDIDTSTVIARGVPDIHIPIVSANMDTVTESEMAITMARHGGIGIIHRFMTPEDQAHEVSVVKNSMRIVETHPPTVPPTITIKEILDMESKKRRGYVIISDRDTFLGIATTRDFDAGEPDAPVSTIMIPRERVISVPPGTSLEDAVRKMKKFRIEKIPVIDEYGHIQGVYALKDDRYQHEFSSASRDDKGRLLVGAAIGVQADDVRRAHLLTEAGADVLVLDIAHGGLDYIEEMLHRLKIVEKIQTPVIAGNAASVDGVKYIVDSGADGVKIGVGPGFVCTTRNIAGTGIPQITAIYNAVEAMKHVQSTIPIMADGGIREEGDLPKAIGAGADSIMIGSLFAGTRESPGEQIFKDDKMVKMVRGMASASAFEKRVKAGDTTSNGKTFVAEGTVKFTPYKGSVVQTIYQYKGGLQSGMSYAGAASIKDMQQVCVLQVVSSAGAVENKRSLS